MVAAGLLVFREIEAYRTPGWVSTVTVDTRPIAAQHHIELGIDVTLPGMRCSDFGFDLADVTGELQLNAGRLVREPYTGPGHGRRGGCRAYGRFELHRVDGDFHVAFGRVATAAPHAAQTISATQAETLGHYHHFTQSELWSFNASHTVNHLQFGDARHPLRLQPRPANTTTDPAWAPFADSARQPLDGETHTVPHGADSARFWYLVKVVPVRVVQRSGAVDETYEYTYLRHVEPVKYGPTFRQPGLFFKYTISPYVVVRTPVAPSLYHTVASCLAIVGGMRALALLLASAVVRGTQRFAPKHDHASCSGPRVSSSRIGDPAPSSDDFLYL